MDSASVLASTEAFKSAMRRFATGVCIVTTESAGTVHGFTVNAFASVSAEPPCVLVCVNRTATAHPLISAAGRFCVNVLGVEQQAMAERFAGGDKTTRFAGLDYRFGPAGSPILPGVLAYFDCSLAEEYSAGTHTIFIGNVVEAGERPGSPLGYYDRGYHDFHLG
jgi:flavin reductase (DIM6/NTAB) family NADH-FMN oxidoreductase RutF